MNDRGSRSDVQAYNRTLVDAYWGGESVASIAKRSGRHTSTIHKLIQADQLENGPRERTEAPRDPRVMMDKRVLTERHGWIGLQISRYRAERDLTPSSFGMLVSVSRVQVRNMEIGAHDFTLCELERVSKVLGVTMEELFKLPDRRVNSGQVGHLRSVG